VTFLVPSWEKLIPALIELFEIIQIRCSDSFDLYFGSRAAIIFCRLVILDRSFIYTLEKNIFNAHRQSMQHLLLLTDEGFPRMKGIRGLQRAV
jgi:hypothetical protein